MASTSKKILLVILCSFSQFNRVLSKDLKQWQESENEKVENITTISKYISATDGGTWVNNISNSAATDGNFPLEIDNIQELDDYGNERCMHHNVSNKRQRNNTREWYKVIHQCTHRTHEPGNCIPFLKVPTAQCALCHYENDNFNTSVCFVQYPINLTDILVQIDRQNAKSLKFVLNNTWTGNIEYQSVLNLNMMADMVKLVRFQIVMCYVEYTTKFHIHFNTNTFKQLTEMVKLRINIPVFSADFSEMVSNFPKLEILDLSFVKLTGMEAMAQTVQKVKRSIVELNLNNFQTIGSPGYYEAMNFTMFFGNGSQLLNLHDLTIRDNSLTKILPNISTYAPNLKVLDISYNIIVDSTNAAFLLEVLLHPSLRCFYAQFQGVIGGGPDVFQHVRMPDSECMEDLGLQNTLAQIPATKKHTRDNRALSNIHFLSTSHMEGSTDSEGYSFERKQIYRRSKPENHRESFSKEQITPQVGNYTNLAEEHGFIYYNRLAFGHFIACCNDVLDRSGTLNISLLFTGANETQSSYSYELMKCMLPVQFKYGPPKKLIPPLKEIFRYECMLCLQIPVSSSILKVDISNQQWEKTIALGLNLHGNFCFRKNNVHSLRFLDNSAWLKAFKVDTDVKHLNTLIGLNALEVLDLSLLLLFIKNGCLPNLKNLSLSGNNVSLQPSTEFCAGQPLLISLEFYRCRLGLYQFLPVHMIRGCSHLELLHLGGNNLNNSNLETLHFHGVYNLSILNLTDNALTALTDVFITKLNHLQSMKKSVNRNLTIDLSENNILCNCGYYKFAMWLVTGHHKHAIQIQNDDKLKCLNVYDSVIPISKISPKDFNDKCSDVKLVTLSVSVTLGSILLLTSFFLIIRNRW